MIRPYLKSQYDLRVLDVNPPRASDVEFVQGSLGDPDAVGEALHGCETFINMVMLGRQGGRSTDQSIPLIESNYAVNTLGLHVLLFTAHGLGIRYGVHTSTMSVHYRERPYYHQEESTALDSPSVYGLTKGLGEQICSYFARWFDMNLVALRITAPRKREDFLDERRRREPDFRGPLFATDEEDLARAYLSALKVASIGHGRFDAYFIAGDESEAVHNLTKARRGLGWAPESQALLEK
jgi:nucleoside-diphosphate-sugar epimerase